jgi:hypothetical protein
MLPSHPIKSYEKQGVAVCKILQKIKAIYFFKIYKSIFLGGDLNISKVPIRTTLFNDVRRVFQKFQTK